MSEEEKEAIIFFKEILKEFEKCNSEYLIDKKDEYGILKYMKTTINLIEKQQKEIEILKTQLEQEIYANKILNSCLNDFYDIRGDEDE